MYGVGGDPETRFPRKLSHTGAGTGVHERWSGGRFDYLDPALRSALTEWPHFDEVDGLLMSRVKCRVEIEFIRNRMEQMRAPIADRSQHGVEVLEYFALGGHAFACVVAEQMPREPGVVQFVRFFYVEALDAEAAAAFAHEQATAAQAVAEQRQREEAVRMQMEAEAARLAQIDEEEKEREERLLAESMARDQMEKLRLEREAAAPPDLNGIKRRVRSVVAERFGNGMKGIKRFFDSVDSNRRGKWSLRDMEDGLRDYGIAYTGKEVRAFYSYLDVDRLQSVSFDSFYIFIKGELPTSRKQLVNAAFDTLGLGQGEITLDDIRHNFDASMHADVMSGKKTEQQVVDDIVDFFAQRCAKPGVVTREDFEDYYGHLGAHIEDDSYFGLSLKRTWKML